MNIKTRSLTTPKHNQGAYIPASSTVEAALVVPLFMYAALAVIYVLQIISVKMCVQTALYEDARKLSGYVYAYQKAEKEDRDTLEDVVSVTAAWTFLIEQLGYSYAKEHYIIGGNAGLVMAHSKICSNDSVIELKVTYTVKNPFDIFGIGKVTLTQVCKTDAWLGEEHDKYSDKKNQTQDEEYVYVTAEGEVYHTDRNCTYLTRVIIQKEKSDREKITNVYGEKYYPCERCGKRNVDSEYIYVTEYGNRFHIDITCSQLSRTILEIPVSKVGERRLCKKCGGTYD